jgi:phage/plasmid-like protein (TIGR03299 family)
MTHEVYDNQIAYVGETPWWLPPESCRLEPGADMDAFLETAKLNWTLEPQPVFTENADGELEEIRSRVAFVRSTDRKVMTVASPHWIPRQNRAMLESMQRYVTAGGASFETVGALRDGQVVWGLAKLNHDYEVRPGDKVTGYLLMTASHQVGRANTAGTTAVRVVCANTMRMADPDGKALYKQNHMSEFDEEAAREAIGEAHEQLAECERRSKILDGLRLSTDDALRDVLIPVFLPKADNDLIQRILSGDFMPKKIEGILNSIERAPGAIPGTAWGIINGITHYCDHAAGRNAAARFWNAQLGDNARRKLEAEELLFQMATV